MFQLIDTTCYDRLALKAAARAMRALPPGAAEFEDALSEARLHIVRSVGAFITGGSGPGCCDYPGYVRGFLRNEMSEWCKKMRRQTRVQYLGAMEGF